MGDVGRAVAGLSAALDACTGLDLAGIPAEELLALAAGVEKIRRRLSAIDCRVIDQLEQRRSAHELGARTTADLLVRELRISPSAAKRRVAEADGLLDRPALAAAIADGAIDTEHLTEIRRTLNALPAEVDQAAAEQRLVRDARAMNPQQLRQQALLLRDRLDPNHANTTATDHQRRRDVTLRRHADGSADITGHLTPEAGIKWQTILSAMSAPKPAVDGTPDERTAGQRRHDGLLDIADKVLTNGALPDAGGTPVTLVITATADQVSTRTGLAKTEHGARIDMTLALQLADNHDSYLYFEDLTGQLHLGRRKRLAQPALRRALAIRDGGCTFPGCDTPSSWTQAHHIQEWKPDGQTDINNMTLVCGYHHREHQRLGWTVQIENNQAHWTPPPERGLAAANPRAATRPPRPRRPTTQENRMPILVAAAREPNPIAPASPSSSKSTASLPPPPKPIRSSTKVTTRAAE